MTTPRGDAMGRNEEIAQEPCWLIAGYGQAPCGCGFDADALVDGQGNTIGWRCNVCGTEEDICECPICGEFSTGCWECY